MYDYWKSDTERLDIEFVEKFFVSLRFEIEDEYRKKHKNQMTYEQYLEILLIKYRLENEKRDRYQMVLPVFAIIFSFFILLVQLIVEMTNIFIIKFGTVILFIIIITKVLYDDLFTYHKEKSPTQLVVLFIEHELKKLNKND